MSGAVTGTEFRRPNRVANPSRRVVLAIVRLGVSRVGEDEDVDRHRLGPGGFARWRGHTVRGAVFRDDPPVLFVGDRAALSDQVDVSTANENAILTGRSMQPESGDAERA